LVPVGTLVASTAGPDTIFGRERAERSPGVYRRSLEVREQGKELKVE
jgi:hypothetical protein